MRPSFFMIVASFVLPLQTSARWLGVPTVPFVEPETTGTFSLKEIESIMVNTHYEKMVDNLGETLIPPTLKEFAHTFSDDLSSSLGLDIPVTTSHFAANNSIFMTIGNGSWVDAAGRPTSEGYTIDVTASGIVITGASPLGAWWATRTIMQQGVLNDLELDFGTATDSPGWGIRGIFLDIGRRYYPAEFLIEMCSYLSYFKQNTFHLHLSNSPGLLGTLTMEEKLAFYSAFRLNSPSADVAGLNHRPNESYYQEDFESIQQSCAQRGLTIIPEIEAPGHALVITQWKPELALDDDFTLLNISVPETIPVMQTIWSTFLPRFHCKTVHLGADEYLGAVADYNDYVNTMYEYIGTKFSKAVRIWGTFVPSSVSNETNINTNVTIQHWEYFEANPLFNFMDHGYSVLNSDDQFYIVNKWSGSYHQSLNMTKIFHGAPDGGPTAPYIFDSTNATNNPPKDSPFVLGQLPALWNDFGPNATSTLEAYYALREGLPALGDNQWGGDLLESEYNAILGILHASIPGQNLDRVVPSRTTTIFSYQFTNASKVTDVSGNGYDGTVSGACSIAAGVLSMKPGCAVDTPLTSKGKNYTLSFSIRPTSSTPGTLFTGSGSALRAANGSIPNVILTTGGQPYILNYTLPVGVWTDVKLISINNATYLATTPANSTIETVNESTITLGVLSNSFVWGNPMSIEAPISKIGGDSFEGQIKNVTLVAAADPTYAGAVAPLVTGVYPYTN